MVTMKTVQPPLDSLAGRVVTGVRRAGKMPVVDFGDLSLLVHLMSAGRLPVFGGGARGRRPPRRGCLTRLAEGGGRGRGDSEPQRGGGPRLPPRGALGPDEAGAPLGRGPGPPPPVDELAELLDQPRHL